jgi:hypothetical protein
MALGEDFVYLAPACAPADAVSGQESALLRCFAPVFVVADGDRSYNRIGTPFYTSLLPWQRQASRLDRLDRLLRFLKFHLALFETEA